VSIRFLADYDLNYAIVKGARLREPAIDFLSGRDADLQGVSDPEVLRIAASAGRILVSHDKKTLPGHFAQFLGEQHQSPGVLLVSQRTPIGDVIEALMLIWLASDSTEWQNQIVHLPSLTRHSYG
jgi:hypothetical protein